MDVLILNKREMKKLFFVVLLVGFSIFSFAETKADSLTILEAWKACEEYDEAGNRGDYAQAYQSIVRALNLFESVQGKQGHGYARALQGYGTIILLSGNLQEAENLLLTAHEMLAKDPGPDHLHYAESLYVLGYLYLAKGRMPLAKKYTLEAIEAFKKSKGENSVECSQAYTILATIYIYEGRYAEALEMQKKTVEITIKTTSLMSIPSANALSNLGSMYYKLHDYRHAIEVCEKAIAIGEQILPETQQNFIGWVNVLGTIYMEAGDYEKAEKYLLRAARLRKAVLGENNPDYARSLNNLATLYSNMNDNQRAKDYFEQVFAIDRYTLDNTHPDYVTALANLGNASTLLGEYREAEAYLLEAASIMETDSARAKDITVRAQIYNLLAYLYSRQHDYVKETEYYGKSLAVLSDPASAAITLSMATPMHNMAILYARLGNLKQAAECEQKVLTVWEEQLGERHPFTIAAIKSMAFIHNKLGDYSNAEKYALKSMNLYKDTYIHYTDFMTQHQRECFWDTIHDVFDQVLPALAYRYCPAKPEFAGEAYNNELFRKGVLLSSSEMVKRSILQSNDSVLNAMWEQLNDVQTTLVALYGKKSPADIIEEYKMREDSLEKQLTLRSAIFRERKDQWNVRWEDVRNSLKKSDVAIEFFTAPLNMDSTMYCALLLRKKSKYPQLVPLFEMDNVSSKANTIWSILSPYLKGVKRIYFAATGALHQIPIEYAPFDVNTTWGDHCDIIRLSSTRELVQTHKGVLPSSASLFGGIYYDMDVSELTAQSENYKHLDIAATRSIVNDSSFRSGVHYLRGTQLEVEEINTILKPQHITTTLYTAGYANEESFKALSGKHVNILHIATHGFYWTDTEAQKQRYFTQHNELPIKSATSDPMSRCGLLFAGANIALRGHGDRLPADVQDGILTAQEISLLDLRDAQLVILSACETGKGEVTGDGVFGLQRAFKMAGARSIIMTLWPVNDEATRMFMTSFFRNYSQGKNKRDAFRLAQQEVRNYHITDANQTIYPYKDSYYWAGFILLD